VLIPATDVYAQEKSKNDNDTQHTGGWASLGIRSCHYGLAFSGGFSYAYNENVFTLQYLKADEFRFNVEGNYDEPALSIREIDFLYGRSLKKEYIVLSLSGGVGVIVKGTDRGKPINYRVYEKISMGTFGIPLMAEFRIEITDNMGIGGSCFGDINPRTTFLPACLKYILENSLSV
jgi:hypothetical protein